MCDGVTDNVVYRSLSLKPIYDEVCSVLEDIKHHTSSPVCLILDGVSVLLSLGVSVDSVSSLCQYCRLLVTAQLSDRVSIEHCLSCVYDHLLTVAELYCYHGNQ